MKRLSRATIAVMVCLFVAMFVCVALATWIIASPQTWDPEHYSGTMIYIKRVIEENYNENGVSVGDVLAKVDIRDEDGNDIKEKIINCFKFSEAAALYDGEKYLSSSDTVTVGNTYSISYSYNPTDLSAAGYQFAGTYDSLDASNKLVGISANNRSVFFKYKTVQIATSFNASAEEGSWYTIEEALREATSGKTVVVAGSNTTTYTSCDAIVTAFTALDGIYEADGRTIKSGVTLLLPYNGTNGTYTSARGDSALSNSAGYEPNIFEQDNFEYYRKLELIVPAGVTLTNNGTITVGGCYTGGNGGNGIGAGYNTGRYAQITLGKDATIESNGNINAYGFIMEEEENNGSAVNMNSGTLTMLFVIMEHRGGSIFYAAYSSGTTGKPIGSPFNQYYMRNITSLLTIQYDASVVGKSNIYATTNISSDIPFIGKGSTNFIQFAESGAYATWKYSVENTTIKLDIYGNLTTHAISVELYSGRSISTENAALPLPWYYELTFHPLGNTATVDSTAQAIKVLPGATLRVAKGVTLKITTLAVYDSTFEDPHLGVHTTGVYPSGKGDGHLIVNGTLIAANLGGNVETEMDDAVLNVTTNNGATSSELLTGPNGMSQALGGTKVTYRTDTLFLTGDVYGTREKLTKHSIAVGEYTSKDKAWITGDSRYELNYSFAYRDTEGNVITPEEKPDPNNQNYYTTTGSFELVDALLDGYTFLGWYTSSDFASSNKITDFDGSKHSGETVTLYGLLQQIPEGVTQYTINYVVDEETMMSVSVLGTQLTEYKLLTPNDTDSHTFEGWYLDEDCAGDRVTILSEEMFAEDSDSLTLYAKWNVRNFTVSFDNSNTSISNVTINGNSATISNNKLTVPYGATVSFTVNANNNYENPTAESTDVSLSGNGSTFIFTMPARDITILTTADESSCIAEGTLIMLPDGTQKPVEELNPGDEILVFNHETGQYEAGILWYNAHLEETERAWHTIVRLYFSDGTEIGISYRHAFFDLDLNKYVYLDSENYSEFIGHRFSNVTYVNGEFVSGAIRLMSVTVQQEFVRVYEPLSEYHLNFVNAGLLSMPAFAGGIDGLINIFEYDANMKYDETKMQADIEMYGLFTYEDWAEYATEEDFNKTPAKYFKVALAKGLLTMDDIYNIIRYLYDFGVIS